LKVTESNITTRTYVYVDVTVHMLYIVRNFNSPNHGGNIQHIKHQAKTNLIKSVVTGEPTKLLRQRFNRTLGNTVSQNIYIFIHQSW